MNDGLCFSCSFQIRVTAFPPPPFFFLSKLWIFELACMITLWLFVVTCDCDLLFIFLFVCLHPFASFAFMHQDPCQAFLCVGVCV